MFNPGEKDKRMKFVYRLYTFLKERYKKNWYFCHHLFFIYFANNDVCEIKKKMRSKFSSMLQ